METGRLDGKVEVVEDLVLLWRMADGADRCVLHMQRPQHDESVIIRQPFLLLPAGWASWLLGRHATCLFRVLVLVRRLGAPLVYALSSFLISFRRSSVP